MQLDIGKSDYAMKGLRGSDCSQISQYKEDGAELYITE